VNGRKQNGERVQKNKPWPLLRGAKNILRGKIIERNLKKIERIERENFV